MPLCGLKWPRFDLVYGCLYELDQTPGAALARSKPPSNIGSPVHAFRTNTTIATSEIPLIHE